MGEWAVNKEHSLTFHEEMNDEAIKWKEFGQLFPIDNINDTN